MAVTVPITNYENIQGNNKYVGNKLTDFCFYFLLVMFPDIFQSRYIMVYIISYSKSLYQVMLAGNAGKLRIK
jgi:hypothetical protein